MTNLVKAPLYFQRKLLGAATNVPGTLGTLVNNESVQRTASERLAEDLPTRTPGQLFTPSEHPRGCFDSRIPESQVVHGNADVYMTEVIDDAYTASSIVSGAPSSGTRFLQRREAQAIEASFWGSAQPMVSTLKGAKFANIPESEYWAQHARVSQPKGCGPGLELHDERSCMTSWGLSTSYRHHVGSGLTSTVDVRRNCDPPPAAETNEEFRGCCAAPDTGARADMSAPHYWSQAQTHGVNEIQARHRIARWEQAEVLTGTLSMRKYDGVVHPVTPLYQADALPSQGKIDNFWAESDAKSRRDSAEVRAAPERSCWPVPGGAYNPNNVGEINMKRAPR